MKAIRCIEKLTLALFLCLGLGTQLPAADINDAVQKLDNKNGVLIRLIKSGKENREIITELYLTALSRFPKSRSRRISPASKNTE